MYVIIYRISAIYISYLLDLSPSSLCEVDEVLRLSAVALPELGAADAAALRAPHRMQLEHEQRELALPWEAILKPKTCCLCRDVFCRKDGPC